MLLHGQKTVAVSVNMVRVRTKARAAGSTPQAERMLLRRNRPQSDVMKIITMSKLLGVLWLLVMLCSCDGRTLYSHYESTDINGWERGDTLSFEDIVVKATGDYKEEIGLRINDSYPFRNLFLVVEQRVRPMHAVHIDTLSCRLIDKDGRVRGRGLSYYQYNFHLTTLHLNAGDTVDIRVRHHMKREILPGIANVGMRLEKN